MAEPPAKKARTCRMNINELVDVEWEKKKLSEIADAPTTALQGIAERGATVLAKFRPGAKTVRDLGRWKYYKMAKAITGFSEFEKAGKRKDGATLNIDKAVDKEHEHKSLEEIAELPPSALEGLAKTADAPLKEVFGVKTIRDLANLKYARWAEWITDLAECES
mmetsp:Transcript_3832/g.9238  ORF Transcript_3832/g.9238 Transcript_3832/m.9238 type:complete len:164 (-) Transcript_3832:150-641(-)